MKPKHKQILQILNEFIKEENLQTVLTTSLVDEEDHFIISPQLNIKIFIRNKNEIIANVESNGENGFTKYQKKYKL
jgi:hypothetical protein